ncbi:unnamed protein product [Arctogadus glacialis]
MKRNVRRHSRWDEGLSTVEYALRSFTSNNWKMLTLGSGFEETWSQTHERPGHRQAVVDAVEEKEDSSGDSETSRRAEDTCAEPHRYSSVVQLGETSRPARGHGVRVMVERHEALNSTPWSTKQKRWVSFSAITPRSGLEMDLAEI